MPWTDWQFWIVTILALGSLWLLYRTLRPRRRAPRTTLTIEGTPARRKRHP